MKCGKIFNRRPLLGVILVSTLLAAMFSSSASARTQSQSKRSSRVVYRSMSDKPLYSISLYDLVSEPTPARQKSLQIESKTKLRPTTDDD